MLENKKYTCFPSFEKLVIGGTYLSEEKVVVDGNIITSKAAGTTFEFAYEIIKYLKSESIAKHIKEAVFYKVQELCYKMGRFPELHHSYKLFEGQVRL